MAWARRLAMGGSALVGVLGLIFAVLMLLAQPYLPAPEPRTIAERRALNIRVFDNVWRTVDRRYYDRSFHGVDWRRMRTLYRPRAANAASTSELHLSVLAEMLAALHDRHTTVVPPEEWTGAPARAEKASEAKPARGCPGRDLLLGASPADLWGGTVIDVRRGSPADAAGVEPGWRVTDVNVTVPSSGCRWSSKMRVLDDQGAEHFVRADAPPLRPPLPARSARTLPGGARLLAFRAFRNASVRWLLGELDRAPPQGVVLDLRRNGGGHEFALKVVAGALLGAGAPLGARLTHGSAYPLRAAPLSWWRRMALNDHAPGDRRLYRGPLALLVGPGTMSAAEILADAVQHAHRGLVLGDTTAGSVLDAKRVRLPDGGELSVSVGDYRDPSGRRLEGRGVTPDVQVRQTLAAIRTGRDLPLEAADARLTGR